MSIAIATKGMRLIDSCDYEPVSEGSRTIRQTSAIEKSYLSRTASDWLPTIEAVLRDITNECRSPNWDGGGAVPVTVRTADLAEKIATILFTLLPKGTPVPDVVPEPDGEICLSWSIDETRMFSVSIGEHGKINFAGQFGKEGGIHAWQPINAASRDALQRSLDDVVRYVSRLYAGTAIRRAA